MVDTEKRVRAFRFGGSELNVPVRLNEPARRHFSDCPNVEEIPIYTSGGYRLISCETLRKSETQDTQNFGGTT